VPSTKAPTNPQSRGSGARLAGTAASGLYAAASVSYAERRAHPAIPAGTRPRAETNHESSVLDWSLVPFFQGFSTEMNEANARLAVWIERRPQPPGVWGLPTTYRAAGSAPLDA
jgi:hypothetical protein